MAKDRAAFVFSPDADPQLVEDIRDHGMPDGVRYVASVTGPWQIFAVTEFDQLSELPGIIRALFGTQSAGPVDPPTATSMFLSQIRKSTYLAETALVRIRTDGADPEGLLGRIREAIDSDEADHVYGDFDILACVVADDEEHIGEMVFRLRQLDGVLQTVTLRVIDYVSLSPNAPAEKRPRTGAS
jgi:hypothetical protein